LSLPETERLLVIEYEDVFGRNLKTEAHLEERHNLGKNANERGMSWDVWSPVFFRKQTKRLREIMFTVEVVFSAQVYAPFSKAPLRYHYDQTS